MIKTKHVIFLFFFFTLFIPDIKGQDSLFEQSVALPYPSNTQTIDSKANTIKPLLITSYSYSSELSPEEIINFYRELFISKDGWHEENFKKSGKRFTVEFIKGKGLVDRAVLYIRGYFQENEENLPRKISYDLTIFKNQDVLGLSIAKFEAPKVLNYAPIYQGSKQIGYFDKLAQWKVVGYLAKGEVSEIAAFYSKEMPKFQWQLVSENPYEGRYNILDIFAMGHQNHGVKLTGEETLPGVSPNIKATVLTFKQEAKRQECVINIIQFIDSPEVLRQERIAPEPFEKYGNVWIQLIVYNENDNSR